ncbi:hypothetical protein WA577_000324, partial [Blastocystis sp. JDR]
SSSSAQKRLRNYDLHKLNSILSLLSDEVDLVEKVLYAQRNPHHRSSYFKSATNLVRYCRNIVLITKDVTSHLTDYEPMKVADGLLQVCNYIYKAVRQGKESSKNSSCQLAYQFYMRLCITTLGSSCRLVELCLLLLEEIIPLQQAVVNANAGVLGEYTIPQSILSLLSLSSAKQVNAEEHPDEVDMID